eukprot:8475774-Pyramimonas_sp.AAC.1
MWSNTPDTYGPGPGRVMQLAASFAAQRYLLVGTMETRLRAHKTQNVGDYLVFHSSATPAGAEGCALWVHSKIEYMPGYTITQDMCRILHAEPTRLVVAVRGTGLSINVL